MQRRENLVSTKGFTNLVRRARHMARARIDALVQACRWVYVNLWTDPNPKRQFGCRLCILGAGCGLAWLITGQSYPYEPISVFLTAVGAVLTK